MAINYLNFSENAADAYQRGRNMGKQLGIQNALKSYETDPQGSQNALIGLGAFDEAKDVSAFRSQRTAQDAGKMASRGDWTGAQKAATAAGDFDLATKLQQGDDNYRAHVIQTFGQTAQIGKALKEKIPVDPANPQAGLEARKQAAMQYASQFGVDPNEVAKWDFSDQALDTHYAEAQQIGAIAKPKLTEVSPGASLYNPDTHAAEFTAPQADKWVPVPEGGTLVNTGAYGQNGGQQTVPSDTVNSGGGSPFDAVISAESGGNQLDGHGGPLTSPKGAIGIAQVMPGTAPEAAQLAGLPYDEQRLKTDPQYNASLGSAYFKKQMQDFRGDTAMAWAAYNAGPGAVRKALAEGGPGWLTHMPAETQAYVAKNQAFMQHAGSGAPAGGSNPNVIQGNPKPKTRPGTEAERAQFGLPEGVPFQVKPDGTVDVIQGAGAGNKQVPPAMAGGYIENRSVISQIDAAIAQIKKHRSSFGLVNLAGDTVMQRYDPDGVKVRAAVSAIAGKKRHDISGAAVSPSEDKNLRPFIPNASDTPEAAIAKLEQLKTTYENSNAQIETAYSPDNGYRSLNGEQAKTATQGTTAKKKLVWNVAKGDFE